jgi:hypothetical protein
MNALLGQDEEFLNETSGRLCSCLCVLKCWCNLKVLYIGKIVHMKWLFNIFKIDNPLNVI